MLVKVAEGIHLHHEEIRAVRSGEAKDMVVPWSGKMLHLKAWLRVRYGDENEVEVLFDTDTEAKVRADEIAAAVNLAVQETQP